MDPTCDPTHLVDHYCTLLAAALERLGTLDVSWADLERLGWHTPRTVVVTVAGTEHGLRVDTIRAQANGMV